jgi:FlaA1/EpsC-like NDP-sugar epimerase
MNFQASPSGLRTLTLAIHLAVIAASFWLAWLLRFDFSMPGDQQPLFFAGLAICIAVKMPAAILLRLHRERWWGYQGFPELVRLLRTNAVSSAASSLVIWAYVGDTFPRSVYVLDLLLCFLLCGSVRFAVRLWRDARARRPADASQKSMLIYGAGVAGIALGRELRDNPALGYRVVGFLDDDLRKKGAKLMGLPVLGSGNDAAAVVQEFYKRGHAIDEIAVAMPSAAGRQIRIAVEKGRAAGVACRIVPGLGELISGKVPLAKMKEISVTDLLGRDPVELDLEAVRRATEGRSVLVTGAAGSIGSELCAQLAGFEPRFLIAFDQAESELFRLEAELRAKYPNLKLVVEVGDIRNIREIDEVLDEYGVNSIFHAAAYKHVPMMQRQICEAVRNNVLGTWNLAQAAWRAHVSNFLLISTDKAVNPTSIMGMTKRVAELIVSAQRPAIGGEGRTKFVSVRFGNVLVSNGSVVPIFQKQIASGGPVTVTHPDMRRYFMTVQEAVQLVLQASTMGGGSETFVLEMGKPMKILDLARNMISLAGFQPDEDIEIRFTGLRPGEKLFEELSLKDENTVPTNHAKIRIFRGRRQLMFHQLVPWITELQFLLWRRDSSAILNHLRVLVPEYQENTSTPAAVSSIGAAGGAASGIVNAANVAAGPALAGSGLLQA